MNRQGYIKISRGINTHWLWQDANRLKWWLDLLLLANWEDAETMHDAHKFTLKRGQIIASVSFLKERWKVSHPTIIKFLTLLEQEGMITRTILYRQTPIITICKYEDYQGFDNAPVYGQVYGQVYTQVYTNKKEKEINNISTPISARVKETEILSQDLNYAEIMCMRYHLTREQYTKVVEDFFTECGCNGVEKHDSVADLKSHFNNWLRIKKTRQDNGKQDDKYAQRKPTTAKVGSRAEYEGAF